MKLENKNLNESQKQQLNIDAILSSLRLAGKLALAARLVTTSNAKNLSRRIQEMETALDAYDNEIFSLSNDD